MICKFSIYLFLIAIFHLKCIECDTNVTSTTIAELQFQSAKITLDVDNCLRVTCKRNKINISLSMDPGIYYVCNNNKSQSLNEALCSLNSTDPNSWFSDSDLQTYVTDYVELQEFSLADPECPIRPQLTRQTSDKFCYKNSTCCLTKKISKLFGKTPCRMDYACENASIYRSKEKREVRWARNAMTGLIPPLFLLGWFAIFGNLAVIINSGSILRQPLTTSKEIRAYNIFLLNLALADFLMGFYMVGTTSIGLKYILSSISTWRRASETDDIEMATWINNNACSFFGSVNFLSSQASVTALVSITGLRLYGVCFPYRNINLKAIKIVVFASWICWIVLCCLPVLNIEPIKTLFVDAIQFEEKNKITSLRYFHLQFVLQKLVREINKFCGFPPGQGYALKGRLYWELFFTVAKKLKVLNFKELNNLQFLSYYSVERGCAPRFLVHYFNKFFYFSLSILAFNTASFAFIVLGQIGIAKKSFKLSNNANKTACCCWSGFVKTLSSTKSFLHKQRETENQHMRRKMFIIVMTDFCCWIPICIISIFYNFSTTGQDICTFVPYRENSEKWFYIFAMVMLPINSVINPFVYSYTTRQTTKSLFRNFFTSKRKKQSGSMVMTSSSISTVSSKI